MNTQINQFDSSAEENTPKYIFVLGFLLLFQAVTSLVSGAVLFKPHIVEGNIQETMINFQTHYKLLHLSVFLDIITALGIICLGAILYQVVKKYNPLIGIIGLSMYIFEAGLLVVSKFFIYVLIQLSDKIDPTLMRGNHTIGESELMGELLLDVGEYAYNIHIIPFGIGAICFYYLLTKSSIMPKWMSFWGLLTAPIILVCVPLMTYGIDIPFVILLPYVPFEFLSGSYLMIKSIQRRGAETRLV